MEERKIMEEDLTYEEDFDPGLSTTARNEITKLKQAIKELKQELKSKNVPLSRLEELKINVARLSSFGVTPSQLADLESLMPQPGAFNQKEEKASGSESSNLEALEPKVTQENIEDLYARAHTFYFGGQYKTACFAFSALNILSPEDPRFIMGMAACYLGESKYNEASILFALASAIDIKNPVPTHYLAECQLKLNQVELALQSLEEVILRSLEKPEHAELADRAKMTLQKLKNAP